MEQNSLITDAKIEWLEKNGYVIKKTNNGKTSYYVTNKGKEYLND
jgi:predicted transcriptional regulator